MGKKEQTLYNNKVFEKYIGARLNLILTLFFRRAHSKYEMLPADANMKAKLYQGFTKEEKGRL